MRGSNKLPDPMRAHVIRSQCPVIKSGLWLNPGRPCVFPGKGWRSTSFRGTLVRMNAKLTMIYWKSKKFWLGRLVEHPDIMTQGRTLRELEENIRDAYRLMILEDVPEDYAVKEIAV